MVKDYKSLVMADEVLTCMDGVVAGYLADMLHNICELLAAGRRIVHMSTGGNQWLGRVAPRSPGRPTTTVLGHTQGARHCQTSSTSHRRWQPETPCGQVSQAVATGGGTAALLFRFNV